ncbi:hypothetical protein J3459_009694 [Metarhizium acridum]|nr:hypothetical protein J3459_009694 [Metarhizium acridum]
MVASQNSTFQTRQMQYRPADRCIILLVGTIGIYLIDATNQLFVPCMFQRRASAGSIVISQAFHTFPLQRLWRSHLDLFSQVQDESSWESLTMRRVNETSLYSGGLR